ncbi:MAG TPA: hypothetical protein VGJ96_01510 [Gemmatimonadaceae bacterium]|jgi:hypothetical protein
MPPLPTRPRPSLPNWRRAIATALLALQAVVAWLPLGEQRGAVRFDSHVEAPGSLHLPPHDDATCAVCAARALWGTAPQASAASLLPVLMEQVDIDVRAIAPAVGVKPDNHSRAPPVEG